MAINVFGNPVTDETVKKIYPNLCPITAQKRAEVALLYMNEDDKVKKVTGLVHKLKADYGDGTSTLCMIYNATGGNLTFVLNHTWEGSIWQSPYSEVIQNGQWAGFLHVHDTDASKAAIVYRGQNNDGVCLDWMLCWNTPSMNLQNHVYAEIRKARDFDHANWNQIDSEMERQTNNYSTTALGGFAASSIGGGSSPEFVGIMSLADVVSNCEGICKMKHLVAA